MTGFTLSQASAEDAGPLARILGDWLRESPWMPVLHSRLEDIGFLDRMIASHQVTVARDGSCAPLGFIAVKQCDIAAFHVDEAHRGKGIGKALLDAAKAEDPRLALWTFQANTRAIAFYTREGFSETGRTDGACNAEGLPDVRMIWRRPA